MRMHGLTLLAVAIVVAAVHGGAVDAALSHHDRLLVAVANGGADAGADGFTSLCDRVARLEAGFVGARSANYRWIGLILLAATAVAVGAAVRRLRTGEPADRTFPIDAGLIAAVVFAAAPLHVDSVASLSGHARLLAVLLLAVTVSACSGRPKLVLAALALAILAPLLGASEAAATWFERARSCAAWVAATAPPSLDGRAATAFRWSFGGIVLGAIAWSMLARRDVAGRLLATCGGGAAAIATTALAFSAENTIVGASIAVLPLAFLAAALGGGLDAVTRRGTAEIVALALVVFWVYSSINATGIMGPKRNEAVAPAELELILESLRGLDPRFERVVVLGLPPATPEADPAEAVIAASSAPWRRRARSAIPGVERAYAALPDGLLAPDAATVVVEWRAPHPFARRPGDWKLVPLLACREPSPRIQLVSPGAGDELTTKRPDTIEDDVAFEFDVAAGRPLANDEVFVFTAVWDGGRTPRGRDRVTGRVLARSVLATSSAPSGATRYRWRTSVRPGKGEDGVYFDDPDMSLAGKPMWWTVGIARGSEHAHGEDHADHDHAHGGGTVRSPHDVAQTRRVRFR